MKFRLEFDCDNAAFGECRFDMEREIAATFKRVVGRLSYGNEGKVMDTNGNTIGKWKLEE